MTIYNTQAKTKGSFVQVATFLILVFCSFSFAHAQFAKEEANIPRLSASQIDLLLRDSAIQNEIGLSKKQQEEIALKKTELRLKKRELIARFNSTAKSGVDALELKKLLQKQASDAYKNADILRSGILNDKQLTRLSQIIKQKEFAVANGKRAQHFLLNYRVIGLLELEELEVNKLAELQKRAIEAIEKARAEYEEKVNSALDGHNKNFIDILAPDKKKLIEEMFGKRFDVSHKKSNPKN